MKFLNTVTQGDCLELMAQLPAESVNCCVTSPPYYGLRDYKPHTRIGNASVHHSPGQAKAQYTTRNKRTVWTVTPKPFKGAHFATFAPALIEPCILAGCPTGGVVLDPFAGAGTTGIVATAAGRQFIQFELNQAYCEMARKRLAECENAPPLFPPQPISGDEVRACA